MPDELAGDPGTGQAPAEGPSLQDQLAERDRKLAVAEAKLGQMEETFKALQRPPTPEQAPPQGRRGIPDHIRREITARGMTEAEIDANSPIILPIVEAYLGAAASEVLGIIQGVQDDVAMERMARQAYKKDGSPGKYPYFDQLYDSMVQIRQESARQGRYLPPETAYKIAFAQSYDQLGAGSGAVAVPAASPQTLRSRDAGAGAGLRNVRAPAVAPESDIKDARDLLALSPAERRKFYEQHGNTPIEARR
jgi:hypothetical protein